MSTRVTVVIPAYNAAEFVAEAIDSALAQTHRDVQVTVVDDGSTDATPAILAGYGSRIAVVRQPNRGPAAARNRAIRDADGALVALLDADDRWEESFLAQGVARLAACDASVVGAFSGWVLVDRAGHEIPDQRIVPADPVGLRDLVLGNRFHPSTLVLRRRAVLDAGGFDEDVPIGVEDYDLWLRLAVGGGRFAAVGQCLCRYRVSEGSVSHRPDSMRAGRLLVLERLFARAALPADVGAARPRALASAYMQSAVQLYAAGRADEGARDVALAVRSWPTLLDEDETYYAVVCASQPLGYKASRHGLDLDEGERRLAAALARCAREQNVPSAATQRAAHARALGVLARLAYGQRRMAAARRYAVRALAARPALWVDWPTVGTLVKSFAGATVIETLSRWKRPRRESSQGPAG